MSKNDSEEKEGDYLPPLKRLKKNSSVCEAEVNRENEHFRNVNSDSRAEAEQESASEEESDVDESLIPFDINEVHDQKRFLQYGIKITYESESSSDSGNSPSFDIIAPILRTLPCPSQELAKSEPESDFKPIETSTQVDSHNDAEVAAIFNNNFSVTPLPAIGTFLAKDSGKENTGKINPSKRVTRRRQNNQ